jgi:hypothetical protein
LDNIVDHQAESAEMTLADFKTAILTEYRLDSPKEARTK